VGSSPLGRDEAERPVRRIDRFSIRSRKRGGPGGVTSAIALKGFDGFGCPSSDAASTSFFLDNVADNDDHKIGPTEVRRETVAGCGSAAL